VDGGFFRVGLGSQCFFRGGAGGDGVFFFNERRSGGAGFGGAEARAERKKV
jgi:hypothetical protein